MSTPTSLDEDDVSIEGSKRISHLAHGINGILVNATNEDEKQQQINARQHNANNNIGSASLSEDERKMPAAVSRISISDKNNHIISNNKTKQQQFEEDCDRSQSSRSSWDGKKNRRSSFRNNAGGASRAAGRGYSPRWRDQEKQLGGVAYSDDNASIPDESPAATAGALSYAMIMKKASSPGITNPDIGQHDYHDSASQTSQADSLAVHAHDSEEHVLH